MKIANFQKIQIFKKFKFSKYSRLQKAFVKPLFYLFFRESLSGAKFTKTDVSGALALCMAAKEESEITTIKKACQVSVDIFSKYLKEQIMDIIDNDKVSADPWSATM